MAREKFGLDSIIALPASLDFDQTIAFYRKLDFVLVSRHDDYLLMRHGESGPKLHFWLTEDRSIAEATGIYARSTDVDTLAARWRARRAYHQAKRQALAHARILRLRSVRQSAAGRAEGLSRQPQLHGRHANHRNAQRAADKWTVRCQLLDRHHESQQHDP
jgi:hypothetical protein